MIPATLFEEVPFGVLLSDNRGGVQYMNKPASELLRCSRWSALGSPCWKVALLQTSQGAPFCDRNCPVQEPIKKNGPTSRQWKVSCFLQGKSADATLLTMLTIPFPPARIGRYACLHFLAPRRLTNGGGDTQAGADDDRVVTPRNRYPKKEGRSDRGRW